MPVIIRYFASLKETLGKAEEEISGEQPLSAEKVWQTANPEQPLPDNILVAINMDYAELDDLVKDGDEIAFFPPVTGG
jgi:molybdopterin synthase sulfur carrier subunit